MYDFRGTVLSDVHAGQAPGHLGPTASEPRRLPRKPESIVPVRSYRPVRERLVAILYSSPVERVDSAEFRIHDTDLVPRVGECQSLLSEKNSPHGNRWRSIP